MELFLYTIIFITGIFFGSFFTLAVYRIPKKEDILIKHSYCPNCNSRLGFFDLFPVLSYICLGGKCRYCKNKIRPRYLILELLSGFTFLILAFAIKTNFYNITNIISTIFLLIYVSILFIIAGIDKENINIEKPVLIFGFCIEALYIIYQYTVNSVNVYQYVMYIFAFAIVLLIFNLAEKQEKKYITQNLFLSLYILIYCKIKIYILTIMLFSIIILGYKFLFNKKYKQIPVGFYLSVSNILIIAMSNIITNYII